MWKDDSKSYLVFGHQLNQVIAVLQMVSDNYPNLKKLNTFVRQLIEMRPYDDMLDEFIFGDQKSYPKDKTEPSSKDVMTLEDIMNDLQLRFMDARDKDNGKN